MMECTTSKYLNTASGDLEFQFDFSIPEGIFVGIYGASGAGKTSLLRMISGLMQPDEGKIHFKNEVWFDSSRNINQPVSKRKIGFVFQDYALFPNMTVRGNLEFASPVNSSSKRIDEVIDIMDLGDLNKSLPANLSAGQQQRVALARAITQEPELLLLDEPLSALDSAMQSKLQEYLIKTHKEFQLTTLFVSHDISHIMRMADYVMVIENRNITKCTSPQEAFGYSELSGKFQLTGKIINLQKEDIVSIASVLIGKNIVKVVISGGQTFDIGDEVIVASKAFNPVIRHVNKS